MDTSLVERMIKRKKPLIDEDIETLDTEEIEYYIYDGFDSLTPNQRELLLNKAKISKINISDIEYLIEQIEELKESEKEQEEYNETTDYISTNNYIEESKNKVTLGDFIIANSIYSMLNEKEEKKESISNDYEPYQFEEEELEDDDYYFEDPD